MLLCCLGYLPGLIHSWYIIAAHPPYPPHGDTSIYYVYRNDLESQTPLRNECHVHHHVHNETLRQEPIGSPQFNYGAIQQGPQEVVVIEAHLPEVPGAPPKYTEIDDQ